MSNLHDFNKNREMKYLKLIDKALIKIDKNKNLQFKNLKSLVGLVGEFTKIHTKTLRNNELYKERIQNYLNQRSRADQFINKADIVNNELASQLAALKLENGNLKQKNSIIEKVLKSKGIEKLPSKESPVSKYSDIDFTYLANVFVMVLNRFEEYLYLDIESKELRDLVARPSNRIIISGEKLEPFIRWFTKK